MNASEDLVKPALFFWVHDKLVSVKVEIDLVGRGPDGADQLQDF